MTETKGKIWNKTSDFCIKYKDACEVLVYVEKRKKC